MGLPGHGPLTAQPWSHYSGWNETQFIEAGVALCKQFATETPLTVIGHSAGALPALGAALCVPEVIERLILINPTVWSCAGTPTRWVSKSRAWPVIGAAFLGPKLRRQKQSVDAYLAEIQGLLGDAESFYSNPNTRGYIESGHEDYKRMKLCGLLGAAKVLMSHDMRPLFQAAGCRIPALIVHGTDDPLSPVAQSEWLAQNLPRATLVILQGVGHIGFGERESEFVDLATHWLNDRTIDPVAV